jgi:hypothetical protein
MKKILFFIQIIFLTLPLIRGDHLYSDPYNSNLKGHSPKYQLLTILPFHFPLEATLGPDYKAPKLSIGTELLSPGLHSFNFLSGDFKNSNHLFDVPLSEREFLRFQNTMYHNPGSSYFPNRNPGLVLIFSLDKFKFHMDLNWVRVLDISDHSLMKLYRPSIGVSYSLPQDILMDQINSIDLHLNLQTIGTQSYEEKFKKTSIRILKNQILTPAVSIGTKKGWSFEADLRMPLPYSREDLSETFIKNDLQGRIGLKWYLPDEMKP